MKCKKVKLFLRRKNMDERYRETVLEYKGYTVVREHYDDPFESPREWSNLGTMYCAHRSYNLGDEQIKDEKDLLARLLTCDENELPFDNMLAWQEVEKDYLFLPLYLYDHSGITMNTGGFSCHRDSGKVGYIVVEKDKIRKEMGWKRITRRREQKVINILKSEVDIYDCYLRGEIWNFIIWDPDGNEIDACFGFYGDDMIYLEEAKAIIDRDIIEKEIQTENDIIGSYVMAR